MSPQASAVKLAPHIQLRDYQSEGVSLLAASGDGVVVAPCGSGKTTVGIGCIAALKTPALVMVHTTDLAEQWMARCRQQLVDSGGDPVEAGLVGAGKDERDRRVVVATMQTLAKWDWQERYDWGKRFGLVIVDECHHVPCETMADILMTMPARHRLGLSATPERDDGLTQMLFWHLGPVIHRVTNTHLVAAGVVMMPRVEWSNTGWRPPEDGLHWPKLINAMTSDEGRNRLIVNRVKRFVRDGRQVLVLSGRVSHCVDLAKVLSEAGVPAEALVGKLTKKSRDSIMERARDRKVMAIIATSIADEGLDIPGLDAVILTCPTKSAGRIQQRVGRVMRSADAKSTPVVVDLVDSPGPLRGLAAQRRRLYDSLGFQV